MQFPSIGFSMDNEDDLDAILGGDMEELNCNEISDKLEAYGANVNLSQLIVKNTITNMIKELEALEKSMKSEEESASKEKESASKEKESAPKEEESASKDYMNRMKVFLDELKASESFSWENSIVLQDDFESISEAVTRCIPQT